MVTKNTTFFLYKIVVVVIVSIVVAPKAHAQSTLANE
jgi:hypothetical protein